MATSFQDPTVAKNPTPTEFERADQYYPGDRIVSKLTRRTGTVQLWPTGRPHPQGHGEFYGAVWVTWDTGTQSHAWRHQINRL
jgi:hypothetical protein